MSNYGDVYPASSYPAQISDTAPFNPAKGTVWYAPATGLTSVWDGAAWQPMGGGGSGSVTGTATGGTPADAGKALLLDANGLLPMTGMPAGLATGTATGGSAADAGKALLLDANGLLPMTGLPGTLAIGTATAGAAGDAGKAPLLDAAGKLPASALPSSTTGGAVGDAGKVLLLDATGVLPRTGLPATLATGTTTVGAAGDAGKAPLLDASGHIPIGALPTSVVGAMHYKGAFSPTTLLEYPATPAAGDTYLVAANYTFTGGSLTGKATKTSDLMVYDGTSWALVDQTAGLLSTITAAATYVAKVGDTLTGQLTLPAQTGVGIVPPTTLQAVNKGYTDAQYLPFTGGTLTGQVTLPAQTGGGATAPTALQAVNKGYADAQYVAAAGGTMTGALTLPAQTGGGAAAPTTLQAVSKGYTDAQYLPFTGGTLTGQLTLPAQTGTGAMVPTARQATTQGYVDTTYVAKTSLTKTGGVAADVNKLVQLDAKGLIPTTALPSTFLPLAGGTMTGQVTLPAQTGGGATAPTALQAVNKGYADATYVAKTSLTKTGGAVTDTDKLVQLDAKGLIPKTALPPLFLPLTGGDVTGPVTIKVSDPVKAGLQIDQADAGPSLVVNGDSAVSKNKVGISSTGGLTLGADVPPAVLWNKHNIIGTDIIDTTVSISKWGDNSDCASLELGTSRAPVIGDYAASQPGDELGRITYWGVDDTALQHYAAVISAFYENPPPSAGGHGFNASLKFKLGNHVDPAAFERLALYGDAKIVVTGQTTIISDKNGIPSTDPLLSLVQLSTEAYLTCSKTKGGAITARISNTGEIGGTGAFVNLSDARTKEDITDVVDALATVTALQGRYFRRIGHLEHEYGFIAQEVQQVLPEAVRVFQPANPESGTEELLGVQSEQIIPFLVEAIKTLQARIEVLEARAHV